MISRYCQPIVIALSDNICYTRNNSQFKHDASIPETRLIVRQLVSKLPPRSTLFRYQLFHELIYLRVANPPRNRDLPLLPRKVIFERWCSLERGKKEERKKERKERGKKRSVAEEELRRVREQGNERKKALQSEL